MNNERINLFKPLDWQIEPWKDTSPVLLFTGSAGGGKSRLAAEKINGYCLQYPNTMAVMLRKTRESMTNSTVLFMERTVIAGQHGVKHYPSKRRFEYTNGSILAYGGMKNEEQREQIRSIGQEGRVDIAWMEEANKFSEDDYGEVGARMRGRAAPWMQIILTTNPDAPTHWINRRLIIGDEAKVYYSKASDNSENPPAYLETLAGLTGVMGKRLRDGKWVAAEGAVYEDYDAAIHAIDWFEPPPDWRRIRVIDFGYTNPFVCQWWAIDSDGRMYLYREIYMSQQIVEEHAKKIKEIEIWFLMELRCPEPDCRNKEAFRLDVSEDNLYQCPYCETWITDKEGKVIKNPDKERIEMSVSDHDAEDRATLHKYGIITQPAVKNISPGIQAVQKRLVIAKDKKARLFLMRGSLVEQDRRMADKRKPTSTLEEIEGYVWPKSNDGRPVKEVPVKENDHGMDAMRYGVMYVDRGRRSGIHI